MRILAWPRGFRLGLRLRLALACAFLSAAVSIIGLLISLIVVDSSIQGALQFPAGTQIEVAIEGQAAGAQDANVVIDAIRREANRTLLARGLLIALFAGLLGGGAGYIIAARALGPIAEVTATARRISSGSMHERIALGGAHDELRDLADTFDAMLERLDRSFEAQQRFVANASHELRTPLSIIHTEVDVTMADPDASTVELREMGEVVRQATVRANNLVESLLTLARIDAQASGGLATVEDFDLADAVPLAVLAVQAQASAMRTEIDVHTEPAPVRGDPRLLEQLVANLLTNAVTHNIPEGSVTVRTSTDNGMAVLRISNTGRVIDPATVDELFAPFKRVADRTASSGAGLGLSIVQAIVRAHQGTASLAARPDGGLDVEVRLTARPESGA